ncbi:MAG: type ISP restriction/modification enzyme, partial [Patescibacteria group bacterium]
DFLKEHTDTIRSAEHLAKIMGGKGRRLRDNIIELSDPNYKGTRGVEIEKIMHALKDKLIHDLTIEQFADLYAQTLVYGLFVARYHDDTPETFSRSEARDRIPASNHLLQQFFDHIAGVNFEKRLSFIVDELCNVFVHSDVKALVHGIYLQMNLEGQVRDPIIHFYEDFLKEYDPKLRSERGVFYTPLPVVKYIVRSVDKILQEHFGLADGLADRAQIEWKYTEQGKTSKKQIDRVQILDPAVGTGTFLHEVIREVHKRFAGQEGIWNQYVNDHLVPRLHGFELMMASYTIAHLKLSMALAETGVKKLDKRLRIFLTNSLEEAPSKDDTLFRGIGLDGALTEEALQAEEVKRDYPIMVVMGNPPYSSSSQNASVEVGTDGKKRKTWIGRLLEDYKKDLNEKKINLDDDYIKFIRFAHHLIEKTGQGIVAMITNNSFLDGITHRRMRQSLLETFDHVYVLDLHGSSKRPELAPDGGKDENVFDIMQGVGISLFVKTGEKKKGTLGKLRHLDVFGKRESKYDWLEKHDLENTKWQELISPEPYFFFVPKDFGLEAEYSNYIQVTELFPLNSNGLETHKDELAISDSKKELIKLADEFRILPVNEIKQKYHIDREGSEWKVAYAKNDLLEHPNIEPTSLIYRPFDNKFTIFTEKSKGFLARPRFEVLRHLKKPNIALLVKRQCKREFSYAFVVDDICEACVFESAYAKNQVLPLYLYPNPTTVEEGTRTPNLNMELLQPVLHTLKLEWNADGIGDGKDACGPEDIFDYIYAVLHSPTYRERYKEFLKIDFPRVPFTSDKKLFWNLVALGREIRLLHLLESPKLGKLITKYPVSGNNEVEKLRYEDEKVWINKEQYFNGVPKGAWEFPIGGYQPAQKWLKDRKGRTLDSDDILHYQKMIVALTETGRVMREIEQISSGLFTDKSS